MRTSIVSDLHLEMCDPCHLPGGDILLLAGDNFGAAVLHPRKNDADSRSARRRQIAFAKHQLSKYQIGYAVLGNHEHYGHLFEETAAVIREFFAEHAPHIHLLDNGLAELDGVAILGCTLW